ncbi:unnamed protein product, partial [Polarella glacialis]
DPTLGGLSTGLCGAADALDRDVLPLVLRALGPFYWGGSALACRSWHQQVQFNYDLADPQAWRSGGRVVRTVEGALSSLALSEDGDTLVTAGAEGDDKLLGIRSLSSGNLSAKLAAHTKDVCCVAVQGDRIVSGADDGELVVWSLSEQTCVAKLVGHTGHVYAVAVHGGVIVSGSTDGSIKVWMLRGHLWTCMSSLASGGVVWCVALAGGEVLGGGDAAELRVWRLAAPTTEEEEESTSSLGADLRLTMTHPARVYSVSAEGDLVATGCEDNLARIWSLSDGACLHLLAGHTDWVYTVALRGTAVVSGSFDGTVKMWALPTVPSAGPACEATLQHGGNVEAVVAGEGFLISSSCDPPKALVWRPLAAAQAD